MAKENEFDSDDAEYGDESDTEAGPGHADAVYRISKGKLTKLEGGMQQYEEQAAKTSAKLSKG